MEGVIQQPAGVSVLRSSLSQAQTHPCVILSGGWWERGSEGSSEARGAIASNAKACHHVLPSDNARPNRGAGSGCPKQLLYAPGLILRFTPSHPTSLRMTLNLQCFFSQVQRPRCGRAQDDTSVDFRGQPPSGLRGAAEESPGRDAASHKKEGSCFELHPTGPRSDPSLPPSPHPRSGVNHHVEI